MEKAEFSFEHYEFQKITIDLTDKKQPEELSLIFEPFGSYDSVNKTFELTLNFKAIKVGTKKVRVFVSCISRFRFKDNIEFENLPDFFYPNSIAIVYPYIRSMVSTLTVQANTGFPMLLPTMNLMALKDTLKQNTIAK